MRDSLLAEFDNEMAKTRLVLSRVPEPAFAWKPHERSYSLGGLATHLAQLPHWGTQILDNDAYDRHVQEVRARLLSMSDAELQAPWILKRGTHTLLSLPKMAAFRGFLLHHLIHHRG